VNNLLKVLKLTLVPHDESTQLLEVLERFDTDGRCELQFSDHNLVLLTTARPDRLSRFVQLLLASLAVY